MISSYASKQPDHSGFSTVGKLLSSSVDTNRMNNARLKSAFVVKTELPPDIYQPIRADVSRESLHIVPKRQQSAKLIAQKQVQSLRGLQSVKKQYLNQYWHD